MTDSSNQATLIPVWEHHRDRVLAYGHALHALLPDSDPPVMLHGRDLHPSDEGVGFQFQYVLQNDLYDRTVIAACYVVQLRLVRSRAIVADVNATQLLERRDGTFDVFRCISETPRIGNRDELRDVFAELLTPSATRFFANVRNAQHVETTGAAYARLAPTL